MDKMDEMVMVVGRDVLFGPHAELLRHFKQGYCPASQYDFMPSLFQHDFKRRGDVEQDQSFKQPIAYCAIVNPVTKKVFAYQRADQRERYTEDRLAGNWSWGFGGHIHPHDKKDNFLITSLKRELSEETTLGENFELMHQGYINDDRNEVGRVHFGIFYMVLYQGHLAVTDEAKSGEWLSYADLKKITENPKAKVDSWSRIVLKHLKDILEIT